MLTLDAPPHVVLAVVADLATYPGWLDLVTRAEPTDAVGDDPGPAWDVELRGRVGPLARSKLLRMVRSQHDVADGAEGVAGGGVVRFERRDADGRSHSPWVLTAAVEPAATGGGSTLTMRLHYGGSLWGPVLDHVLADAVERGRSRLPAVVEGH